MRSKSPSRSKAARSFFFTTKRFNIFLLLVVCRRTPVRRIARATPTGRWRAGDRTFNSRRRLAPAVAKSCGHAVRPPCRQRGPGTGRTGGGCLRMPQPAVLQKACPKTGWSGIRTRDPPLLRRLLYPIELSNGGVPGVEPGEPPTGTPLTAFPPRRHTLERQTKSGPGAPAGNPTPGPLAIAARLRLPYPLREACQLPAIALT